MRSSTPTAFKMGFSKGEKLSRRRGWVYFILCERVLHSMCAENIPSKDVYVFFILRRRVQRYCTAVRVGENKKYIHRQSTISYMLRPFLQALIHRHYAVMAKLKTCLVRNKPSRNRHNRLYRFKSVFPKRCSRLHNVHNHI